MENPTNQLLQGPRIRLRAPEPADAPVLYRWENDPSLWQISNTAAPFSMHQIEEYILSSVFDLHTARQLRFILSLKTGTGREIPVGTADLFDFEPLHQRAGVGIFVQAEYRDTGFAKEALGLLIPYAFGHLGLHQLFCHIAADNAASIRLFEGLGFLRCGTLRDWVREGGQWNESLVFQLINDYAGE